MELNDAQREKWEGEQQNLKWYIKTKSNMGQAKFDENKSETNVLYYGLIGVSWNDEGDFPIPKYSLNFGQRRAPMMTIAIIKTKKIVEIATERIVKGLAM